MKKIILILANALLLSCAAEQQTTTTKTPINNFSEWKEYFKHKAQTKGYPPEEIDALLNSAQEQQNIIKLDQKQNEFTLSLWQYLERAVNKQKIITGKYQQQKQQHLLRQIEQQTGVSPYIVLAIWGIETDYGRNLGQQQINSALATLAYEGRRKEWAEAQLFALLDLKIRGDIENYQQKSSWAGAMGQTQFMPESWLQHSQDGNHDQKHDPYQIEDALQSTAYYLQQHGYKSHLKWGYEVSLPENWQTLDLDTPLPFSTWQALGVKPINDESWINKNDLATLWIPAGINAPIFLLSENFQTLKKYNNSSSYALAVSLLADQLQNAPNLSKPWPTHKKPLSRSQIQELQQKLQKLGYDPQGIDGIIGPNTIRAFRAWQKAKQQIPDGFIHQQSAEKLLNDNT